ncbi:MAG: hypothetical protein IT475_05540 [Aquimonas sp.]|jgi:hypothetical protein|nr:hypothetical protein [Aquimonas sp.]
MSGAFSMYVDSEVTVTTDDGVTITVPEEVYLRSGEGVELIEACTHYVETLLATMRGTSQGLPMAA